ncbi:putative quinol monooxygenase [Spirosoma sp. KNUC1025]|uniref:putative quinol monooxygenase n=1 Tax=Spirosoma sp. KNUC1025 TaxID=2894082 RepID=UPI001E2CD731|nr:antibiotic biosynthesis monooxygenase family protein [Spirosoma sp. KNUC1025]UFH57562.1 antibiotic biosynthesis monooxygenase [Spirosoma sp. KNUC1025]
MLPQEVDSPVVQLTTYSVKPDYQNQMRQALSTYVLQALKTEGNVMAEAYAEIDNPSVLWLIERWEKQEALAALQEGNQAKDIDQLAKVGLTAPAENLSVTDLEPLSRQDWLRQPNPNDNPMTVMLFVDAKPGTQDEFTKRYHAAMPAIRSEAGVITYQLTQLEGVETRFLTYEKFRNPEALQTHLVFPPVEPILDFLHTSITNPPFEQGLHKLTLFAPISQE